MIKKANITWSAKQITKMVGASKITFENVVQRGYVWDTKRKSLLIHSMLSGYPIPPFYATKRDGVYDMLDGKQRMSAITGFINGEYKLEDVPEIEIEDEVIDINGLGFEEMSEDLQDEIKDYSLTIYYFEDITDDEISEMFYRLNNGKPLSAIELTRVKAKSISTIIELGKHELFKSALTEKAIQKYTNEDIVMKTYTMLFVDDPSLENKDIRRIMLETEITNEQSRKITDVFDKIMEVYALIEDAKVRKKLLVRTHLISTVPFIERAIEEERDTEDVAAWIAGFFDGTDKYFESYNERTRSGSNKRDAVRARNEALENSYVEFFEEV